MALVILCFVSPMTTMGTRPHSRWATGCPLST
ncbi:hypothetical protein E2C01_082909 [Portunus trituberculatus]|uniref:Uncharacterized protein n=1 Tax=Portunus trituberculatus TaxID=210409 RepID=A0A5B7ITI6_PORTR|nr:hypothetical protein [Portunus trituberculatus]